MIINFKCPQCNDNAKTKKQQLHLVHDVKRKCNGNYNEENVIQMLLNANEKEIVTRKTIDMFFAFNLITNLGHNRFLATISSLCAHTLTVHNFRLLLNNT